MEMPARRSNYSLVSQIPDDHFAGTPPLIDSSSGDGKTKFDRAAFDWDSLSDHRRIGNIFPSLGLQRHSSGSSFGESSLSGEFYAPTLSTAAASEIDAFAYAHDGAVGGSEVRAKFLARIGGSYGRSWAQQTEESYQLQLALALRLSSEATRADDPNFLDPAPDESALRSSPLCTAEAVSHRFWVCC